MSRARLYCPKHKRRHSLHAAMHCRTGLKPGECDSKKPNVPRGDRCPVWRPREA